jgi:choline dehydrogenase
MRTVIVGAGPAGMTCAWKLSEDPGNEVLILESGIDPGLDIPGMLRQEILLPGEYYWDYNHCLLSRGKVFGASPAVNAAAAQRGHPWCYDAWGSPEWTWQKCLPAFCALEADQQFGEAAHHGSDGPIAVTRHPPGVLDLALNGVYERRGIPRLADHNGTGQLGYGPFPTLRAGNDRISSVLAFLPQLRSRPNVDLRANSEVTRVVISGGSTQGVAVRTPDRAEAVIEADLVLLCAGTFGTPEILFRSGIGPADHLRASELPVMVDAPELGSNLSDHVLLPMEVGVTDLSRPAMPGGAGTLLTFALDGDDHPEAQLFANRTNFFDSSAGPFTASVTCALVTPISRGRLDLGRGRARVHLNRLSHPLDRSRAAHIVAGAATVIDELVALTTVKQPDAPWWHCDDLEEACRRKAVSYHHAVGTCRMGSDSSSVVDESLRVRGVDRLMVADASVMPSIPRAQTNFGAMMIGYRAAADFVQ